MATYYNQHTQSRDLYVSELRNTSSLHDKKRKQIKNQESNRLPLTPSRLQNMRDISWVLEKLESTPLIPLQQRRVTGGKTAGVKAGTVRWDK